MSANPVKGESTLTAGGVDYTLRFTMEAFVQIEQRYPGKRIIKIFQEVVYSEDGPPLADLRFLIWQGLQHHYPQMTEKEAGEIIFSIMQESTILPVLEAGLIAAFPNFVGTTSPDPLSPPTGTGVH